MNSCSPIICYAGRTSDGSVLEQSSSGGAFTEIARVVFARGGVVIGAAWEYGSHGLRVVHKVIEDEHQLSLLRGSKYVASDMAKAWSAIKENLNKNRMVLFTGTPCQTAAVRKVYKNNRDLILVAVICHANVASDIWYRYVLEIEGRTGNKLINVSMRDKRRGWATPTMLFQFEDAMKNFDLALYNTPYGRAFRSGLSVREACLNCGFRNGGALADLMIGDLWGVDKICSKYNDCRGASAVLVCSEKGGEILSETALDLVPVSYSDLRRNNPRLEEHPKIDDVKRQRFFKYLRSHSFSRAVRIAEIGRLEELKEHYYLSHPVIVNSLPLRVVRALKSICLRRRKVFR